MRDYLRLLRQNRFRISPQRIPMSFMVGACASVNSLLALTQRWVFSRKIERTEIQPPIFVIGHWRSGTTLLHELMALDPQFGFTDTMQCFVPHHFLVSRPMISPVIGLLLPRKRPMDNMSAGPAMPQEDEFALCALGAPTPYRQMAFCRESPVHLDLLNMQGVSEHDRKAFTEALRYFYRAVSYKTGKRLVLKSPPHTGRIGFLKELFPDAKFVHITRSPYRIFPSAVHLWRSLYQVQSYQLPPPSDHQIEQYVHDCYERMYSGYFEHCDQLPTSDLAEIKFEQLVEDPTKQMERIYEQLDLSLTRETLDRVTDYAERRRNYQGNQIRLDESVRLEIDRRWSRYLQRYAYEPLAV